MRALTRTRNWFLKAGIVACIVGSAVVIGLSGAEALTYTLDNVFSGNVPDSSSPYGTITFTDIGGETVQITFTASLEDSSEFITEWDFNVVGIDPTALVFTFVSSTGGVGLPTISKGTDAFKADGDGLYDVFFEFPQPAASRLNGTDTSVWNVTCNPDCNLDASDFAALSSQTGNAGPNGPFHTAAHVQGITPDCSGWVSDTVGGSVSNPSGRCGAVPEPSTVLLFGAGLVGLTVVRRFAGRPRA